MIALTAYSLCVTCFLSLVSSLLVLQLEPNAKPSNASSSNGVLRASAVSARLHLLHRYRTEQHHNVITILPNNMCMVMIRKNYHYGITVPEQLKERYEPSRGKIVNLNGRMYFRLSFTLVFLGDFKRICLEMYTLQLCEAQLVIWCLVLVFFFVCVFRLRDFV